MAEQPFEFRGVKIPMVNIPDGYLDLSGGSLNTSVHIPWNDVISGIKATGANNVMLILSTGVLAKYNDNTFDDTIQYNPPLDIVRKLIALIQANGMEVSISGFVNLANIISGDPGLQGQDRPHPTDPVLWQQAFSEKILGWAAFAEEVGATAFLPFEDVTQHLLAEPGLTEGWLTLIDQIRATYSGALSTTWWTGGDISSVTRVPTAIIDKLDYLGIGLFPDLTHDTNASVDDLVNAYFSDVRGNNIIQQLQSLYDTYGKKIWITDKAFHSFDGAAYEEARIFNDSIPLTEDQAEQAALYESFLKVMTMYGGDWMAGVSFQSYNNIIDTVPLVARFMNGPLSESPQGKPAEKVMTEWFLGLRQGPGVELTGTLGADNLSGGYHHDRIVGGPGNDVLKGSVGNDVLVGGSPGGTTLLGYNVEIDLRGITAQQYTHLVRVLDDDGALLLRGDVTANYTVGRPSQTGAPTTLKIAVEDLQGLSLLHDNWVFRDMSDTGNLFVHVDAVRVNGQALNLSQALVYMPPSPYTPTPGRVDGVNGGGFTLDLRMSNASAQQLAFTDDDVLDGGEGIDTAEFHGARGDYVLARNGAAFSVSGPEGLDTLINIERLAFADKKLAIDFDGNAGTTAKILGAVFGAAAVGNATYAGIGLNLLDQGMNSIDLMALALDAAGARTPQQIVELLWTNVVGSKPTDAQAAPYIALLQNGTHTPGSLGMMAADLELNHARIDLVGLAALGLEFI